MIYQSGARDVSSFLAGLLASMQLIIIDLQEQLQSAALTKPRFRLGISATFVITEVKHALQKMHGGLNARTRLKVHTLKQG